MSCTNCHLFLDACKAECCGVIPIHKDVYEKNKHLIKRTVTALQEAQIPDHVVPYTSDARCVFLSETNRCVIYSERPAGCRFFGNEEHPVLFCRFQRKNGSARSQKEFQEVSKKLEKRAMKYLRIKSQEK